MSEITTEEIVESKKEYILLNEEKIETSFITTASDYIEITLKSDSFDATYNKFSEVESFKVVDESDTVYGIYTKLKFLFCKIDTDKIATIRFQIGSSLSDRVSTLETSQNEQDEILSELVYGGTSDE